jgi:hypothetical protein
VGHPGAFGPIPLERPMARVSRFIVSKDDGTDLTEIYVDETGGISFGGAAPVAASAIPALLDALDEISNQDVDDGTTARSVSVDTANPVFSVTRTDPAGGDPLVKPHSSLGGLGWTLDKVDDFVAGLTDYVL